MSKKVVIVTGANAGIGKATVKGLVQKDFHVIMACRNIQAAQDAKQSIVIATGKKSMDCMHLDLADLDSIDDFVNRFKEKYDRLDVLINNAGVFFSKYGETKSGHERVFAINHLGQFQLTYLLLPLLIDSAPSRIMNVSSSGSYKGEMHWNNLNLGPEDYHGRTAYRQSKLANVLFANALSKRLLNKGVTANSLEPGIVRTHIGNKSKDGIEQYAWKLMKPFMRTPEKGAETSVFLASDASVANVSGKFFSKCKIKRPAKKSESVEHADRLWKKSLELLELEDLYTNNQ